jgi:rubrerythrin
MKKTLINLAAAFVGESQARNRYNFYAKQAKKEGYEQIAAIFTETENQEKAHAKRLFEHIQELKKNNEAIVLPKAEVPTVYAKTADNLQAAIDGEHYEHTSMYPDFAKVAQEEGFPKIAARMRMIAVAEAHHEQRYQKLLDQVKAGTVLKKTKVTNWVCRECGYVHKGKTPPEKCPACNHARAYYQVQCENY